MGKSRLLFVCFLFGRGFAGSLFAYTFNVLFYTSSLEVGREELQIRD